MFADSMFLNGIAEGFQNVRNFVTGSTTFQELEKAKEVVRK